MSDFSEDYKNANELITNYDVSKVFIGHNRFQDDNILNNSLYNPISLVPGTVMGRIVATGTVVPLQASASDGSQFPIGILASNVVSLAEGATIQVSICDMGDVAKEKIKFAYTGDGLETAVSGIRLKDRLAAQGIKIVTGFEMTDYDNG